jgi:predicted unusual protein kinase regulating ubiquinone biosynthesis (AarF/ABC1/UbiB family)
VNQAVSMTELDAPDVGRSYVALREGEDTSRDEDTGLPLSYDKDAIQEYWLKQGSALQQRWGEFLRLSVPFLLRTATLLVQGGVEALQENDASLARDARVICEKLGPTFIKLAQTLSVRPDVLPPAALAELAVLQDSVVPFETEVAIATIEAELGGPLGAFFLSISDEPVAAASLAQVYKAVLAEDGREVAVKVQRPKILETVSKDLYVLRRAAEVYQRLMDRFAPQQKTNYVDLLNEWAVGFYTELDFRSEVANQNIIRDVLVGDAPTAVEGVYVPESIDALCTARIAVTEWIEGVKLSTCEPAEIKRLTPVAQEAFLVQLLETGTFHADPHPGNLFKMADDRLAILDFGLVARVRSSDQDTMVNAIVHLANKDFGSLVDDFIDLEILPRDTNRLTVVPLMDKALSPYIAGGGAQAFQDRVLESYGVDKSNLVSGETVGGFQAMTQDALTVLNDVPFSIPPYFALLGRAIVTLEGIALLGDPDYAIIQAAYPFVSRKLLSSDRPALRRALQEALYAGAGRDDGTRASLNPRRLASLVTSALDATGEDTIVPGGAIDLDAIGEDMDAATLAKYVLGDSGGALRDFVEVEAETVLDVIGRQAARRLVARAAQAPAQLVRRVPFFGSALSQALPDPLDVPVPLPFREASGASPKLIVATPREILEAAAPPLNRDDELYALDVQKLLSDAAPDVDARETLDAILGSGDVQPVAVARTVLDLAKTVTSVSDDRRFDDILNAAFAAVRSGTPEPEADSLLHLPNALDTHEQAELRELGNRVAERLAERVRERLAPLAV